MKKSFLLPALFASASLLGACSLNKPDLRYRDSSLSTPLSVPPDLDSPRYSQNMDIPSAGPSGTPEGGALSPDSLEIELPPDMRAEGQTAGKE